MKTLNRRTVTIIPIIAFALTFMISSGISGMVKQRQSATTGSMELNGSYRTLFEGLNAIATR